MAISGDLKASFKKNLDKTYQLTGLIDLTGQRIRKEIAAQIPRFVIMLRFGVILLVMLIQLIPFGVIGYFAYTDIKVTT